MKPPPGAPAGYGGFVPLEKLIDAAPGSPGDDEHPSRRRTDQGALYLTHPALRALYPPERRIVLPTRYTHVRRARAWSRRSII